MIIIHPFDPSTRFLSLIYEGFEDALFFDSGKQKNEIRSALTISPKDELVLMLGHGTPDGMVDRRDWTYLINDKDVDLLINRPNLIGIWCYASSFAEKHKLKGLYCGMFISEYGEALDLGIKSTYEEVEEYSWDFAGRFGELLRAGLGLKEIANTLTDEKYQNSELTKYNYSRLTFRETGEEPLPIKEEYWG